MKKIGLFIKSEKDVQKQADRFKSWLTKKTHNVIRIHNNEYEKKSKDLPDDIFCIFVLGGDGTFLSSVRWMGKKQIPVIGVKFGEVGFLSETTEKNLYATASSILNEQFTIQKRTRLEANVIRNGVIVHKESVLNDIVINKAALARLARIRVYIDDKFLTDYRADGLIISTPTGSTAYSLAAGGPIIHPSVEGILITPICPFTLTNRPLALHDDVTIVIKLTEASSDIILTFDGQIGIKIEQKDRIIIKKSCHPVSMMTSPDQDYFEVLKTKLNWSGSST